MLHEPVAAIELVLNALEALDIPYLIGGSLASSAHGAMRATNDVDIVADRRRTPAGRLPRFIFAETTSYRRNPLCPSMTLAPAESCSSMIP